MGEVTSDARISFGIIVLNGEPFTRYTLRALYPHAYEIIIVEGAVESASQIATPDGHSTDGTLDTLRQFKETEDPDDKIKIITHDGFWSEKDEMSQAYANCATGDYLWQIDVDEFYLDEDIEKIKSILRNNPSITAISFKMLTFWGSPDFIVDGWYLRRGANIYHRLFKWGKGYQYTRHRPPTVVNDIGEDLRSLNWINGQELYKTYGVQMLHYSLLFPKQVSEKHIYYGNAAWAKRDKASLWVEDTYFHLKHPFRVHNVYSHPSWLERYKGNHPGQIVSMWRDAQSRKLDIELRHTTDIAELLSSRRYTILRYIIKNVDYYVRLYKRIKSAIIDQIKRIAGK